MSIRRIMGIHHCGESSIREWAQKYQRTGLSALRSNWSTKQPDLRTRPHRYRPDQLLSAKIRLSAGQLWTVGDLMIGVEQWCGVIYQDAGSYRHLFSAADLAITVIHTQGQEQSTTDGDAPWGKRGESAMSCRRAHNPWPGPGKNR
jgi:transposase